MTHDEQRQLLALLENVTQELLQIADHEEISSILDRAAQRILLPGYSSGVIPFPYTWKYLEERPVLAPWFIFGEYDDGRVDIADPCNSTLFAGVPRDIAEQIIAVRNTFLDALERLNTTLRERLEE